MSMPQNFVKSAAISNQINNFYWVSPSSGLLFSPVKGGAYVSIALLTNFGTTPTFSIIAGSLPTGVTLINNADFSSYISGYVISDSTVITYTFVVRATSPYFKFPIDRNFSITVLSYDPPVWVTTSIEGPNLDKSFNDFGYVYQKLNAVAPSTANTSYHITYSLSTNSGKLPPNLTLSSTGTVSGVINLPFTNQTTASNTFNFTAVASSFGVSTSRSFDITVTYYNSIYQKLTFLNSSNLGNYRTNSSVTIPVVAYDPFPAYGSVVYSKTGGVLPYGLNLNANSGFISGIISSQDSYSKHYQFEISATKNNIYEAFATTATQIFNLDIIQNNYNLITWATLPNLGTLHTSVPCNLKLVATHTETNYNLTYYSTDYLPAGLNLDVNGNIVGIPTTPGTYNFTVVASTSTNYSGEDWNYYTSIGEYPVLGSVNTFYLNIVDSPLKYTNIYAKIFLPISVRLQVQQILNNTDIFETKYIYRPNDTNFGVVSDLRMYVQYGIQQLTSATSYQSAFYQSVLPKNFIPVLSNYEKTFYIGSATIATAYESSNTELYDVIYLKVTDHTQQINILNKIRLQFLSLLNNQIDINSVFLPQWQQNTNFSFIYGIVLCYAIPGKGSVIIKNLKKYLQTAGHFDFSTINFTIDRFIIEKTLTTAEESYLMLPTESYLIRP